MKLFEGIRVTKSILDKVLKESDDIQMGFECEFNMPYDPSYADDEELNVFGAEYYQDVKKYFTIEGPELDPKVLRYYIDDNANELATGAGYDEFEVEQEFMKKKFDEKHWYRDYLDEHGMWDYDNNKPETEGNIPDKDEVRNIIVGDIRNDSFTIDDEYYSDYMYRSRKGFIAEHFSDEEIAQEMYMNDPTTFFRENEWELMPGYEWADELMGTIKRAGAQFLPVMDSFDSTFMLQLFPIDYHATAKENDTWYIEPDSSLGEYGAEVSSAVYPLTESLAYMEQFFEFMQAEELETDESTGLHVSLSFINNDEVEIDWVKLALLMGEEHTLKQFDRVGNTFTEPQLEKIENRVKKADLSGLKDWAGFKELTKLAVETLKSKNRTFNIEEFYNQGRVEFRIMGNAGYEKRYEEIRYHILRFVMMMKIASDENLFKKEYMKKFGTLLLRAKEDALKPHEGDISKDIADNKYFKMARQVFRGRKDIARTVAKFIEIMNYGDKHSAIDILVSLARVVKSDDYDGYKKLLEAVNADKLSVIKRNMLRNMTADYGITKEDLEEYFNKSMDEAFDTYVPVADDLVGGNVMAILGYNLLTPTPEQEAKITRNKNWFLKRIPILRKVYKPLRKMMVKAIAPTLSQFDSDHGGNLTKTFQDMVKLAAKAHSDNEGIRNLLLEILEFRGVEWDDLDLNLLGPKELNYLGIDINEMGNDEELDKEEVLAKYMEKYKSVLIQGANIDHRVLQVMFEQLLFGDKSTGENMLLKMLHSFKELFAEAIGGYAEPDTDAPGYRALMELALKFRPGTNVNNTVFTALLPQLQDWYGLHWL